MLNHLRRTHRIPHFLPAALLAGSVAIGIPAWGQIINEDFKIAADDGKYRDQFGWSIAIDNDTVAVGQPQIKEYGVGHAYLFKASTGVQIAKITASDPSQSNAFGYSIAIDNGIVAVGCPYDDDNGNGSGSAYLFSSSTGEQIAKLLPSDGAAGDYFGCSIAINNGIIAVGAYMDQYDGLTRGSVYLFDASNGEQIFKLTTDDAGTHFGWSVAIDNHTVAIGARHDNDNGTRSGAAYLFDVSTGIRTFKLHPTDGALFGEFGYSVAIENDIVAVGAYRDNPNGELSGSAYLFNSSTGQQTAKLLPDDGVAWARFGWSIAVDNATVVIGADGDDDDGEYAGSAYLFDGLTGLQLAKILPSDGGRANHFGSSVAFRDGVIAIGAENAILPPGNRLGAAYVFTTNSNQNCLELTVDNLIAGEQALFTITNGSPGTRGATVYGFKTGHVSIENYAGYCANFGINGISQNRIIGGTRNRFDANGELQFRVPIPANLQGLDVLFQSAQRGTCPDECISNLIETTIQ